MNLLLLVIALISFISHRYALEPRSRYLPDAKERSNQGTQYRDVKYRSSMDYRDDGRRTKGHRSGSDDYSYHHRPKKDISRHYGSADQYLDRHIDEFSYARKDLDRFQRYGSFKDYGNNYPDKYDDGSYYHDNIDPNKDPNRFNNVQDYYGNFSSNPSNQQKYSNSYINDPYKKESYIGDPYKKESYISDPYNDPMYKDRGEVYTDGTQIYNTHTQGYSDNIDPRTKDNRDGYGDPYSNVRRDDALKYDNNYPRARDNRDFYGDPYSNKDPYSNSHRNAINSTAYANEKDCGNLQGEYNDYGKYKDHQQFDSMGQAIVPADPLDPQQGDPYYDGKVPPAKLSEEERIREYQRLTWRDPREAQDSIRRNHDQYPAPVYPTHDERQVNLDQGSIEPQGFGQSVPGVQCSRDFEQYK